MMQKGVEVHVQISMWILLIQAATRVPPLGVWGAFPNPRKHGKSRIWRMYYLMRAMTPMDFFPHSMMLYSMRYQLVMV